MHAMMQTTHGRRRSWISYGGFLSILLTALAGCGSSSDSGGSLSSCDGEKGSVSGGVFLAYCPDFQNFRSWEAFPLPDTGAVGSVHLAGPKTEYLNRRPAKGDGGGALTEFPPGTIIVKELETGPIQDRKVFGMVKRGGDYNSAGAPGWEWFELQNTASGSVNTIIWRGFGPPVTEQYGGDFTGCAPCHAGSKSNDYVQSPNLQLNKL